MSGRFFLVLPFAVACAAQEPAPEVLDVAFERSFGCGDVEMLMVDASGTAALAVRAEGLVAMAHELEDVVQFGWDLPHPDVSVELLSGVRLDEAACGSLGAAEVVDVMEPVSGHIALNVTPQGDARDKAAFGARIDVVIDALTLEDSVGVAIAVPAVDEDVIVRGPLPAL